MPRAYRCCPEPGVAAEEWNNTRTQRQSGHPVLSQATVAIQEAPRL